ncbi:MAG: trans-sulfuration enzyme family protein, partial [bacterium]
MEFETKAIHVGQEPDPATGAVIPPIYMTSTYVQEAPGKHKGYDYSRTANPTRRALEHCIAALEGGRFGLGFSSGMGAINTVLNLLQSGDHVVAGDDLYGGTRRILNQVYRQFGISVTYVDATEADRVKAAMTPKTKLVFAESPTNPLMKIVDLSAIAAVTHSGGSRLVVDNTFATPYLQRPLDFGADIVVHSATKYLGGHSDVVGGLLVLNDETTAKRLAFYQNAVGAVPSPMDCWLVLRGLKTLAVRMERHCDNTEKICKFLTNHPGVKKMYYPGLEGHPGHAIAKRQMKRFGGMLSIELENEAAAIKMVTSTKLF